MKVRFLPGDSEIEVELPDSARVSDLLSKLGLDRESHVVMAGGRPLTEDERVPGEVTVVRVLSGGQV